MIELSAFDLALQAIAAQVVKALAAALVTGLMVWGYAMASGGKE